MKCSHATFAGLMLGAVAAAHAAPVVTSAFGDSPALIQGSVDAFRSSLGAAEPEHGRLVRRRPARDQLGRRARRPSSPRTAFRATSST